MHEFFIIWDTDNGDDMFDNKDLLNSINSTVQMGQIGIRSVLDTSVPNNLRKALQSQLREYDLIETQANEIASSRGWALNDINPAVRKMADMMTRMRLAYGDPQTKVAAMMIRGNTRGMIIGYKDLHRCSKPDQQIKSISQRLLDCEAENIRQMQGFL